HGLRCRAGYPAPTHGIFTLVTAYPAIGSKGMKGFGINGLPATSRVQSGLAATAQLVSGSGTTRIHHPCIHGSVIARRQKAVHPRDLFHQAAQWPLAGVCLHIAGPIVFIKSQIERWVSFGGSV